MHINCPNGHEFEYDDKEIYEMFGDNDKNGADKDKNKREFILIKCKDECCPFYDNTFKLYRKKYYDDR